MAITDAVAWIPCPLQQKHEPGDFMLLARTSLLQKGVGGNVTVRAASLQVEGEGKITIKAPPAGAGGDFASGIPECATCPVSRGGAPIGCYDFIIFPIDAGFETLFHAFWEQELDCGGASIDLFVEAILPSIDDPGHVHGAPDRYSELEEPHIAEFEYEGRPVAVTSGQVQDALWGLSATLAEMTTRRDLLTEFVDWVQQLTGDEPVTNTPNSQEPPEPAPEPFIAVARKVAGGKTFQTALRFRDLYQAYCAAGSDVQFYVWS